MTDVARWAIARWGRFRWGIDILDTLDPAIADKARAEASRVDIIKPKLPLIIAKIKTELIQGTASGSGTPFGKTVALADHARADRSWAGIFGFHYPDSALAEYGRAGYTRADVYYSLWEGVKQKVTSLLVGL